MPKTPAPCYYPTKNQWFTKVDGQRFLLGSHTGNPPKKLGTKWQPVPKAINEQFFKIMGSSNPANIGKDVTVSTVCAMWCEDATDKDLERYEKVLENFCDFQLNSKNNKTIGNLAVLKEFESIHVDKWLNEFKHKWGKLFKENSKRTNGQVIKRIFQWATTKKGLKDLIIKSPLENWSPPVGTADRVVITKEQHEKLKEYVISKGQPNIAELLDSFWFIGPRMEEVYSLKIEDMQDGYFLKAEHKTEHLGKTRVLVINKYWKPILDRVIGNRKEGYIFLNFYGRRWQTSAIANWFDFAKTDNIIPKNIVPYCYRHAFINNQIDAGVPMEEIAKLCGNTVPTIAKYYDKSKKNMEYMKKLGEKVSF